MENYRFRTGTLRNRLSTADGARLFIMEATGGPLAGWSFAATSKDPEYSPTVNTGSYDEHVATAGQKFAVVSWLPIASRVIGAAWGFDADMFKNSDADRQRIYAVLTPFRCFGSATCQTEWAAATQRLLSIASNYPEALRNSLNREEPRALQSVGARKAAKHVKTYFP